MRTRLRVAIAGLAVMAAACGGSGGNPVGTAGTGTTTTVDASARRAAIAGWNKDLEAMVARVRAAADPAQEWAALDDEQLAALALPKATSMWFNVDGLLDGQRLDGPSPVLEDGDAGPGSATGARAQLDGHRITLAAAQHEVHVYFVNGVLNTSTAAGEAKYQLGQVLGTQVRLYYNRTAFEPGDYAIDVCERAIEKLAAKGLPSENLDPEHWYTQIAAKVADGAATLVEGAVYAACRAADKSAQITSKTFDVARGLIKNNWQLVAQRIANRDIDSADVNDNLVRDVEADLRAGNAAIIVGYSQGTLFVRNALTRIQRSWDDEHNTSRCEGEGAGLSSARVAPVGALYISPAFGVRNDLSRSYVKERERQSGAERYVELEGDILGTGIDRAGVAVAPMTPTAKLGPKQHGTAVHTHYLATYLQDGSVSKQQIEMRFRELSEYAAAKAEKAAECDTTTSSTAPASRPGTTAHGARTYAGQFDPDESWPVKYHTNRVSLTVYADGTVKGSYSVSYTKDDSAYWQSRCLRTFTASGKLEKSAGQIQGEGKITSLQESEPTYDGCTGWDGTWSPSNRGWVIDAFDSRHLHGGVDLYQHGAGFTLTPVG